jgi:hypothetical protein
VSALALPLGAGAGVKITRLPLLGQGPLCSRAALGLCHPCSRLRFTLRSLSSFLAPESRCGLVEKQVARLEVKRRKGNFRPLGSRRQESIIAGSTLNTIQYPTKTPVSAAGPLSQRIHSALHSPYLIQKPIDRRGREGSRRGMAFRWQSRVRSLRRK